MQRSFLLLGVLLAMGARATAQDRPPTAEDQIAVAVLPLPDALRAAAGVRGYDAAGRLVALRQTRNGMVCTGDRPGDSLFDVRCYEQQFLHVIDRRRELVAAPALSTADSVFDRELAEGRLTLPSSPTAGYRMLGPISAFDPSTRSWSGAIERWQSVHFPFRTAAELGLPTTREGTMPFVMAEGTWWSHVMIMHTPPEAGGGGGASRLGTVIFPNSGAGEAQDAFRRGVLSLHSFEYEAAAHAFGEAQRVDPGFALAYWGEAMTHNHPIWNRQDLAAGRSVLERLAATPMARAARATTARERAWLAAVEVLFGEGGKERRDTLYADAMARVVAEHPDDEARAFHALALMGLSQGVRNLPTYMKAGAIALEVLARQPDHPGAAHYVIHAFDDPLHAEIGLPAARAYSVIAPGAAHAQHMTTHIFLALGMWDQVISQNVIAAGPDPARWQAGHYTYWLHYGLLQAGHADSAAALLELLRRNAGDRPAPARAAHLALARSQQVVSGERWNDPALGWRIDIPEEWATARAVDAFTRGFAAVRRGDRSGARTALTELARVPSGAGLAAVPGLLADQLRAVLARADGHKADAERLLRGVAERFAALPVEFGPPDLVKPPLELLGEWLVEDGRIEEAARAWRAAHAAMPGRLVVVRGLAGLTSAGPVR